jgi:hypothetical protein
MKCVLCFRRKLSQEFTVYQNFSESNSLLKLCIQMILSSCFMQ